MSFARILAALACAAVVSGCASQPALEEPPPAEELGQVKQASVDCTTWTDTGYIDGEPFEITLVKVDGESVEINTANAFVVMQDAAAAQGVHISIVSAFRTYDEQAYFYNCYKNCNCNNCNLAAAPGYSNHQSGHALDLNTSSSGVYSWLTSHGADYGFSKTVPSEDWHWEWWGQGPGGGPCEATGMGTPCTVTTIGKSGLCMDKTKCVAQGNHEATSGYCPGPSNYQCCTIVNEEPPPDASVPDANEPPDAVAEAAADTGTQKDSGASDAKPPVDAATDAGKSDAGGGSMASWNNGSAGGCSVASGRSGAATAWLLAAVFALLSRRRRIRTQQTEPRA